MAPTLAIVLVGLVALATVVSATPRRVSCTGANQQIPAAGLETYQWAFRNFNDNSSYAVAKDTLNFDSLATLATAMSAGADVAELVVTVGALEAKFGDTPIHLDQVISEWSSSWWDLADTKASQGDSLSESGHLAHASSAYHRAALYYQLGERFEDHTSPAALGMYNKSVQAFKTAIGLNHMLPFHCDPSPIPYTDESGKVYSLHAYTCYPVRRGEPVDTVKRPTILAMGGYDSSAELTFHEVARDAMQYGVNVVVFDGPGQGSTARFEGLHFRPDFDFVARQIVDFATELPGVDGSKLALWGRSFGGYLAPRGCAGEPRLAACVADGGVLDFFQALLCHFPESLQELLYASPSTFDKYLDYGVHTSLGGNMLLNFGYLGFGASTPSGLFDALSNYTNAGHLQGLQGRPIFVNNPPFDTLVGNQSEIFYAALPRPLSPNSVLYAPDPDFGGALHCSVGSSDTNMYIMDYLSDVLGML